MVSGLTNRSSRPVRLSRGLQGVKSHGKPRANRPGGLAPSVSRQDAARMRTWTTRFWLIGIALSIGACSNVRSTSKDERFTDSTKTIRVLLHDDRQIDLAQEKYSIHGAQDSIYIDGTGSQTYPDGRTTQFTGPILYREVKEIQIIESTTFSRVYTPIIIVIALGGVFVGLTAILVEL
jgi:hypothetical protein